MTPDHVCTNPDATSKSTDFSRESTALFLFVDRAKVVFVVHGGATPHVGHMTASNHGRDRFTLWDQKIS